MNERVASAVSQLQHLPEWLEANGRQLSAESLRIVLDEAVITRLEAIGRTRALTLTESVALERAIRRVG